MECQGSGVSASSLKRVHGSDSDTPSAGISSQKQMEDYFKCRKVVGKDEPQDLTKNDQLNQVPKWNMLPWFPRKINQTREVTSMTHAGIPGSFMNELNQSHHHSDTTLLNYRGQEEGDKRMLSHVPQKFTVSSMNVQADSRNFTKQNHFISDTSPPPVPSITNRSATNAGMHGSFVPFDMLNHKTEPDFLYLSQSDDSQRAQQSKQSSSTISESDIVNSGTETCNDLTNRCLNIKTEHSQRGIYLFVPKSSSPSVAERYISIEKTQCEELREITLPPKVAYVYNPLEYAFEPHYNFVEKFCNSRKKILFLGMNPGPWGMSQNGVPFGESSMVRDWLKIPGAVLKPCPEHPKRQVAGLNCTRSEVSGRRFWGFFRNLCGSPDTFFTNCFVYNMCPFAFMSDTGKNITPPQIESRTLQRINAACDKALLEVLKLLDITTIVGVGKFAYNRARTVLRGSGIDSIRTECIMHPSPINPAANKGWSDIVKKQLQELDLMDTIVNK
ncbi:single-strand selective monofunctional uracil DNA glycosylase-like [Haliotis cracherodii]|uniref:single-strand selective monofunctional uracil DNA glycosylase-like n=1 Tax=Haliotis cracherodii TaxID=6455 RepID=UPI0039E93D56